MVGGDGLEEHDESRTVQEARRLLTQLIETGEMVLASGRVVSPKDDLLVQVIERHASRKVKKKVEAPHVEGYEPKETYSARPQEPERY